MAGACHPHTSYFIPGTYGNSHPTKDASMKKVNQIYQDYLNGLQDIPTHLKLAKGCKLAFSGIGRHFNTEITIDAIDFLKSETVNRDFLEFLNEKEKACSKKMPTSVRKSSVSITKYSKTITTMLRTTAEIFQNFLTVKNFRDKAVITVLRDKKRVLMW